MVTVTVVKIVMTVIVKLEQKKLLVKEDGTEIELITFVIINEDERNRDVGNQKLLYEVMYSLLMNKYKLINEYSYVNEWIID